MEKKKLMLISSIMSMCFVFATVIAANRFDDKGVFAISNETWHHYAAVAPTESKHGSKEFWAKGSEACSTPYFEDPGVSCIDHDFSTYDSFETLAFGDDRYVPSLFDHRNAVYPELNSENNTITYGIYPQTNVNDNDLILVLETIESPESNGWYLCEGEYYAKASATSVYGPFDNGVSPKAETTYWFKCEPITWKSLSNNNGKYYILSSILLDAHRYNEYYSGSKDGHYANNYMYSEIRSWLNEDFYNSAFALNNSYIQTTIVDNSISTAAPESSSYEICLNTNDKVFLPSYQDYINSSYGFSSSTSSTNTRYCRTTDWARIRGAYFSMEQSYCYNGTYWTRSPLYGNVCIIGKDGSNNQCTGVDNSIYSVRPAITLHIG